LFFLITEKRWRCVGCNFFRWCFKDGVDERDVVIR